MLGSPNRQICNVFQFSCIPLLAHIFLLQINEISRIGRLGDPSIGFEKIFLALKKTCSYFPRYLYVFKVFALTADNLFTFSCQLWEYIKPIILNELRARRTDYLRLSNSCKGNSFLIYFVR